MTTKESKSKMWYYWVGGIMLLLAIGGYFVYQKYNNINAKIAEKDAIITTQQAVIESNQKTIEANNLVIANKDMLYRSLKKKLVKYIKEAENIQKPVGEKAIHECLAKHGFEMKK